MMRNKKEYVIHVAGGLANKMFQLAFAIARVREGIPYLYDDFSAKIEFEHDKVNVSNIFPHLELRPMPQGMYHFGGIESIWGKMVRRMPWITGEQYAISHSKGYDASFVKSLKSPCYTIGSFQNENYFGKWSNSVRENFVFAPLDGERNISILNEIDKSNSVAIHVRKGDGYALWSNLVGTCGVEYYERAVKYISEKVERPSFFVFSDSPKWVANNLKWLDCVIIDWNPSEGYGNHFDMQLMSMCKHNIIANSTYSWWGAWLNENPNKIVIGPQEWFNSSTPRNRQRDIIPDTWIKL